MPTYEIEYRVIDGELGRELSRGHPFEVHANNANDAVESFHVKMPIQGKNPALMLSCSRVSDDEKPVLRTVDVRVK